MDKWRHFPAYQLERRADIFFSLYLPGFLQTEFQTPILHIVPEFPVAIRTIHPGTTHFHAKRIDYVAIAADNKVFFIELKTDNNSRNDTQDDYLQLAKDVNIPQLLRGLLDIYGKSQSKTKYNYLLDDLVECGFLDKAYSILEFNYDISIIYLQPNNTPSEHIVCDFNKFAAYVETHTDIISQRFAKSLRNWASIPAELPEGTA